MSEPGKAVFLSYASQDAEAARRICEALRAAGVEVWFDQSELRGGDAWDAMIRKRIKECALFVPVISANTNARAEGYFRLEWKLAVDRSHLMADDAPFLFPVVIGDVSDATARVPDRFREVQWTRLKLEETPAELAGRVARLLAGDRGEETGDRRQEAGDRRRGVGTGGEKRGLEKWWWLIFPIMGMSVPIIGILKRDSAREERKGPPAPAAVASPDPGSQTLDPKSHPPSLRPLSEARQLAERARALSLDKFNSTAADFATAEGLLKRALELDQNDAELWTISSLFNTSIRTRGFDHAPVRRERARRDAERAVALAPDSVNALFALGRAQRDSDRTAAEATFRKILTLDPNHAEAMSQVAWICDLTDRPDEAVALYDRVLVLDPKSAPLTHYIRYLLFFHYGRFAEAEAEARKSSALEPSANAVTGEAIVALTWRGDAAAAARALARAPAAVQGSTRMIWVGALVHLARRDPDETLRTLRRTEEVYLQDNWFAGPKAMFAGLAHRQAGRPEAARVAWEAALAMVDERLKTAPDNGDLHLARGQLLAWLGRADEARREARTLEELSSGREGLVWIYSPALIHAALGDAETVVPVLERLLAWDRTKNNGWPLTPALLRTDVRWDPIRTDPSFQEMIAKAEAAQLAALPSRDWPRDPELKKAVALLDGLDAIPEDFRLAEEIVQRVLDQKPTDPEAVTAMARVQSMWLLRGWDRGNDRFLRTQRVAERAVQLAPDEPEALGALAIYLDQRGTDRARAEELLDRAIGLAPGEARFHRWRNELLWQNLRLSPEEVLPLIERMIALFPNDPLVRYDASRHYRIRGRMEEFERETDAALALAPVANAMVWKARAEFGLRNNLAGMKAALDRVPVRVRGIERTVFAYFIYAVMSGDHAVGVRALNEMTEPWMIDFDYRGPKALPLASLLELQGKPSLARIQYEIALKEVKERQALEPDDPFLRSDEAWALHGLGRAEEARAALRVFNETIERPYRLGPLMSWWFYPIAGNLLMGERATALTLIREAADTRRGRETVGRFLTLDPRMAPFRDDAEIKALLAEPAK